MTLPLAKGELQKAVLELARANPVPSQDKLDRRLKRLERMQMFYEDKQEGAPEKQALMFKGFVSALVYAMSVIKIHRKLAIRINELAQSLDGDIVEAESKTLTE